MALKPSSDTWSPRWREGTTALSGRVWEGSFERQKYFYTLTVPLADPSGDVARRALSTILEVPDEGQSDEIRRDAPIRVLHE
jgi:hypothetical protein